MDTGYTYFWNEQGDCDTLCDNCYDGGDYHECYPTDHDETDSPTHCSACHKPLSYRLTSDGIDYVIQAIVEALVNWDISEIGDILPWYKGCPSTEVLVDWAEDIRDIRWYGVSDEDEDIIEFFLEHAPDTLHYK